ncbi:chalcone isomerase family protein [Massilia scottii]|uniref:chalcone isomerase family protein n=1 Tax=Massilia scottii TaxID=3057166 RepID=UPI0027969E9E|nr:chalcone isomerase family protein [Massilia sp. CCM 9029]MDQ1834902.1 chalcone isomerase family protein [Massilia sp. CCM 9029]
MRMRVALGCLAWTLCGTVQAQTQVPECAGADRPAPSLVINGAGVSSKAFVDLYAAELYLPAKQTDAASILASAGDKSLVMRIRFFGLSGALIAERLRAGLRANISADEFRQAQPHIAAIDAMLGSGTPLARGDVLRFDWRAGGVRFTVNGVVRGCIEDAAFPAQLLRVWLGSEPVNPALKQRLLGISD